MSTPARGEIVVLDDAPSLANEAAERFISIGNAAIAANRRFTVALSGGSTPIAMYRLLASAEMRARIDWSRVHVFWSDERFVPSSDPDSLLGVARQALLSQVPIPESNIHPWQTTGVTPELSADMFQQFLTSFFGGGIPRFDLILLGMGPDGHTASLFPGQPESMSPGERLAIAVHDAPKPPPTRLSFTYRLINNAASVVILAGGADKAGTLQAVLQGPDSVVQLPVQGVHPKNGHLLWLIDAAAAARLN